MNVSSRYYHKISVMTSSHKFQILPTMKLRSINPAADNLVPWEHCTALRVVPRTVGNVAIESLLQIYLQTCRWTGFIKRDLLGRYPPSLDWAG